MALGQGLLAQASDPGTPYQSYVAQRTAWNQSVAADSLVLPGTAINAPCESHLLPLMEQLAGLPEISGTCQ
jgi:hypothetical protein